jgi:hypothetical protein
MPEKFDWKQSDEPLNKAFANGFSDSLLSLGAYFISHIRDNERYECLREHRIDAADEVSSDGVASVGGDVAGNDRDDFGVGARAARVRQSGPAAGRQLLFDDLQRDTGYPNK